MKKLIVAASFLAIAGCTQPNEQTDEAAAPAEAEMAAPTVSNGSPPGTYEATATDGSVMTTVINADGTYSDTAADGTLVAEGTWAVVDGKTCFTPTTEGREPMCFTVSAAADDGSFIATPDAGDPVTVRPAAAAAD
ncbi:hypothetical protein [Altererythrobacter litoralis]|uniref:Lipoprotein n=1 Tax=Altererythrobacter litoralis TaxID=3113904 RepID=A0ABU7GBM0_9SPHN|nr:hypothetical protein [Erythrobacteraceae bacterium 1XM1-14]